MTAVSIRLRLTAWYAGVLLVSLLLFGAGMWLALSQRLISGIDTRLDQCVRGLATGLANEGGGRQHLFKEFREAAGEVADGTVLELRDSTGARLQSTSGAAVFPRGLPGSPGRHETVDVYGMRFRMAGAPLVSGGETYQLVAAIPLEEVLGVTRVFRYVLLGLIPAVLVVASLGGYWLSRRALRPVDRITAAARSIGLQNLSQRIAVPRTGDELQRLSETWNDLLGRLDAAVQRIRQFTADASHEMRTPLALIRGTAELALRRDRPPEEYRRFLRDIESETERMTALTDALLALARSDAGGLEIALSGTDLSQVVESVVGPNQALAAEKGIRLETQTGSRPAIARADAPAIRRLLLVLLDNALKHTPPGGAVTVKTDAGAAGVEISVEDTGCGIAPDALPHIFERFYRADSARGGGGGFGLGLSIAQAIAQAHGSEIEVTSAPGSGARFRLFLKK
ncbi:MAG TPA: ATP-binding protein [Bryobacteraceae bacterium]|nr:ATP-binding protein [Bryobacteraceae bacterium]